MNDCHWLLQAIIIAVSAGTVAVGAVEDETINLQSDDSESPTLTWADLEGVDSRRHSLKDLKQQCVVVCFTSNTCPYSVDYEARLKALQETFQKQELSAVLVAINSNAHKDDSLDKMKERSEEQKFNFAYLRDDSQAVARSFDAIYTPEFFVLDNNRRVIYRGALDDATQADKATVNYVLDAVKAHLAGKSPTVEKTGARGCAIRFSRRRNSRPSQKQN